MNEQKYDHEQESSLEINPASTPKNISPLSINEDGSFNNKVEYPYYGMNGEDEPTHNSAYSY